MDSFQSAVKPDSAVTASSVSDTRSPSFRETLEHELPQHRRWILIAIVLMAVFIRGVFLLEHTVSPASVMHLVHNLDMHFFHEWAHDIAAGDLLSDRIQHPHHKWHDVVAKVFFRSHPERLAELGGDPDTAARSLWTQWFGGKRFHQSPLYPYLIAVIYRLFGEQPYALYMLQSALGVISILLIFWLTRRHFGEFTAIITAILLLFYAPAVFYEGVMLRASLIVFLLLAAAAMLDKSLESPRPGRLVILGLLLGMGVLVKSVFVIFTFGAMLLIAVENRSPRSRALHNLALTGAGILLAVAPMIARNIIIGVPPLALSSVGPMALAMANLATPHYNPFDGFTIVYDGGEILDRTHDGLLATLAAVIRTHGSILNFVVFKLQQFSALLHWYEIPNNVGFEYSQYQTPILRSLPVRFVFVAGFGIPGLLLVLRQLPRHAVLYLLIVSAVVSIAVVQVLGRYKLPLAVVLMPFASLAIVTLIEWIQRRRVMALVLSVTVLVLTLYIDRPLPNDLSRVRALDTLNGFEIYYQPRIKVALSAGNFDAVAELMHRALVGHPEYFPIIAPGTPAPEQITAWNEALSKVTARHLSRTGGAWLRRP